MFLILVKQVPVLRLDGVSIQIREAFLVSDPKDSKSLKLPSVLQMGSFLISSPRRPEEVLLRIYLSETYVMWGLSVCESSILKSES